MTIDEIKAAAVTQPELITQITSSFKDQFVKGAEAEGLIVRTKEQDKTYVDSQVTTLLPGKVEEKFNEKFKSSLDALDAEIATLTSIPKNVNEKTTDYAKRAFKELHSKGADPVTKEKVKELEKMLEEQKVQNDAKIKEKETELFNREIEFQVSGVLDKVNIATPIHLKTDAEKQAYINQQKALIKQGFLTGHAAKKDSEGNIVFHEGDKPLLNTKDGKPKNAGDIIGEKFAPWFVPVGQQGAGTGAGSGSPGAAGAFKNKEDIHKHLASQGLEVMSKEYGDQFEKLAAESKVSI